MFWIRRMLIPFKHLLTLFHAIPLHFIYLFPTASIACVFAIAMFILIITILLMMRMMQKQPIDKNKNILSVWEAYETIFSEFVE